MFRFLKELFGGAEADALGRPPAWSFSDVETFSGAYPKPDRVDYELDLSTWRYRLRATFVNDDPYAESEISYAREEFEVHRSATGLWEVRLIGRNGLLFDSPEAWEAAPSRFLNAWEQAWAERPMSDARA